MGPRARSVGAGLILALAAAALPLQGAASAPPMCLGKPATIVGTAGNDTLTGTNGSGLDGMDVIFGGGGNDTITGLGNEDLLCGGPGNDTFKWDQHDDEIDGGSGTDKLTFATAGITVDVELGVFGPRGHAYDLIGWVDTLRGIEDVEGSPFEDTLAGGPGVNRLNGGGGNDKFVWYPIDRGRDIWNGGDGNDTVDYLRAPHGATVDLALGLGWVGGTDAGTDSLVQIEHADGSYFADKFMGNANANHFSGNNENIFTDSTFFPALTGDADELDGRGGNDRLHTSIADATLVGGDGDDYMRAFPTIGVTMTGGPGHDDMASGALAGSSTPYGGSPSFNGGPGNDSIYATNNNDSINGEAGNDTIEGLDGDDTLVGGPDFDSGNGGAGADSCLDIEDPRQCTSHIEPDTNTSTPSYTSRVSDLHIDLEPHPSGNTGQYLVTVQNFGPAASSMVRARLFFAGRVQSISDSACPVPISSTPGDVRCVFANVASGATIQFTVNVLEAFDPVHTAVVYNAYDTSSPGFPHEPEWVANTSVYESTPAVEIRGIEVTQGIQNFHGDVDLIDGRATWVRVHARTTSGTLDNVTARLHAVDFDSNRSAVFTPSNAGKNAPPGFVDLKEQANRVVDDNTFLFKLPTAWWHGSVLFRAEIDNLPYTCIDQGNDCEFSALFREGPPIHLQLIGIPWTGTDGVVHQPTQADMRKVVKQVQGLMPVTDVKWAWPYDIKPSWILDGPPGASTFTMYRLLTMVRLDNLMNGCAPSLHADCISVGVLVDPQAGGVLLGLAPLDGDAALAYLEPDAHSISHEIGHALGRKHVACSGETNTDPGYPYSEGQIGIENLNQLQVPEAFWGTDVYGVKKSWGIGGTYFMAYQTRDLMTYCLPAWTGWYTYQHLRATLENRFGTTPLTGSSIQPLATSSPAVIISGMTSTTPADNVIHAVNHVASAETSPGTGTHSIKLLDGTGTVLESVAFTPEPYQDSPEAGFALALPWNPATVKIALYGGATELDSVTASAAPPAVAVSAPNGGETFSGANVTVAWSASDPDSDALTYRVQYSPDGGTAWLPVALQIDATSLTIPRSMLKGSSNALFRVTASDGFHEVADQSDATFTVADNAPTLSLSRDLDHGVFVADQTVSLEAFAYDTEDESLPDSAFQWTANGTVDLGSGPLAAFTASDLGPGSHSIQVEVTDSDGHSATAKLHINVFTGISSIPRCSGSRATRIGTSGADVMKASAGEVVMGGGGSDRFTGVFAKNLICGGGGNDRMDGGGGSDVLSGDAGNDSIFGSSGNDRLTGGSGRDQLSGGTGDDLHVGSSGRDTCVGGPGRDRFKSCESVRQ